MLCKAFVIVTVLKPLLYGKVRSDMFYTTGLHDMILAAGVKAIVTDMLYPTGFQDAITTNKTVWKSIVGIVC